VNFFSRDFKRTRRNGSAKVCDAGEPQWRGGCHRAKLWKRCRSSGGLAGKTALLTKLPFRARDRTFQFLHPFSSTQCAQHVVSRCAMQLLIALKPENRPQRHFPEPGGPPKTTHTKWRRKWREKERPTMRKSKKAGQNEPRQILVCQNNGVAAARLRTSFIPHTALNLLRL